MADFSRGATQTFVKKEGESTHYRCACHTDLGASPEKQLYPDCAPTAARCQTSKPMRPS
jgi:hypothetical protein